MARTSTLYYFLGLTALLPLLVSTQPSPPPQAPAPPPPPPPFQDRERTLQLSPDRSQYDSSEYAYPEFAASAVSPFCKSFSFLCHLRCLQRGDPRDAGNILPNSSPPSSSEINRCAHGPGSSTVRVLCICSSGMDLTAEVDYALEGVVDISASGGDPAGTGEGEAGRIRTVAYRTMTKTKTVTRTMTSTMTSVAFQTVTATATVTVVAPGLGPVAAVADGGTGGSGDQVVVAMRVVGDNQDDENVDDAPELEMDAEEVEQETVYDEDNEDDDVDTEDEDQEEENQGDQEEEDQGDQDPVDSIMDA